MVYCTQWPSWWPQLNQRTPGWLHLPLRPPLSLLSGWGDLGWLPLPVRQAFPQVPWPLTPPPHWPPCSHLQGWGVCPSLLFPPRSWSSSSSCSAFGPTPSSWHTGRAQDERLSQFFARAWYRLLYSDGDERTSMWGFIMDVVRKKRKVEEAAVEGESKVTNDFPIKDLPSTETSRIGKRASHWIIGGERRVKCLTDTKQTMATHTFLRSQSIQKSDFSTRKDFNQQRPAQNANFFSRHLQKGGMGSDKCWQLLTRGGKGSGNLWWLLIYEPALQKFFNNKVQSYMYCIV